MSLTTYDSLKLENVTPHQVVASDGDQILIDSPMQVQAYGAVELAGDLTAVNLSAAGDVSVADALVVTGNITAKQAVTFAAFTGSDNRPLVVDSQGKLVPGKPEAQQVFNHHGSVTIVPADSDFHELLPSGDGVEAGSLVIPAAWWETGKRLNLIMALAWNKQSGVGSDLTFRVDLVPGYGEAFPIAVVPLSNHGDEGTISTSGDGAFELDIQVGDISGYGDLYLDLFGSHRLNGWRGRFSQSIAMGEYEIRAYGQFSNPAGSNSITVHAASLVVYEQPPSTSTLIA